MTNEQIKAILDNAPEESTHVYGGNAYCTYCNDKYSYDLDDNFHFQTFVNQETDDSGIQSLADLREILALRERVDKSVMFEPEFAKDRDIEQQVIGVQSVIIGLQNKLDSLCDRDSKVLVESLIDDLQRHCKKLVKPSK